VQLDAFLYNQRSHSNPYFPTMSVYHPDVGIAWKRKNVALDNYMFKLLSKNKEITLNCQENIFSIMVTGKSPMVLS